MRAYAQVNRHQSDVESPLAEVTAARHAQVEMDMPTWSATSASHLRRGGRVFWDGASLEIYRDPTVAADGTRSIALRWDWHGPIPDHPWRSGQVVRFAANDTLPYQSPRTSTDALCLSWNSHGFAHVYRQRADLGEGEWVGIIRPNHEANEVTAATQEDANVILAAPKLLRLLMSGSALVHDQAESPWEVAPLRQAMSNLGGGVGTRGPWWINGGTILSEMDPHGEAIAIIGIPNEQSLNDTVLARVVAAAPMIRLAAEEVVRRDDDMRQSPSHGHTWSDVHAIVRDAILYAHEGGLDLRRRYIGRIL